MSSPADVEARDVDPTFLEYVYQTAPVLPPPSGLTAPLADKYAALLTKTCAAALAHIPVSSIAAPLAACQR